MPHRIHVWHIYLHFADLFGGKCIPKYQSHDMDPMGYIFTANSAFKGDLSETYLSVEPRKKHPRILSIESWLVNRDSYFMVYEIIPI